LLSPKEVGYRWLREYGYRDWVIKFRDLHYPDLRRETGCGCGDSVLGLCDYKHKTLWIQRGMKNTDALETIQHELAHVFCPGEGHSPIWNDWFLYIIRTQVPEEVWSKTRKVAIKEEKEIEHTELDGIKSWFALFVLIVCAIYFFSK
jgi:hypothetical protein